jgi:hypothetical protein
LYVAPWGGSVRAEDAAFEAMQREEAMRLDREAEAVVKSLYSGV